LIDEVAVGFLGFIKSKKKFLKKNLKFFFIRKVSLEA